jgi:hypothetical protein
MNLLNLSISMKRVVFLFSIFTAGSCMGQPKMLDKITYKDYISDIAFLDKLNYKKHNVILRNTNPNQTVYESVSNDAQVDEASKAESTTYSLYVSGIPKLKFTVDEYPFYLDANYVYTSFPKNDSIILIRKYGCAKGNLITEIKSKLNQKSSYVTAFNQNGNVFILHRNYVSGRKSANDCRFYNANLKEVYHHQSKLHDQSDFCMHGKDTLVITEYSNNGEIYVLVHSISKGKIFEKILTSAEVGFSIGDTRAIATRQGIILTICCYDERKAKAINLSYAGSIRWGTPLKDYMFPGVDWQKKGLFYLVAFSGNKAIAYDEKTGTELPEQVVSCNHVISTSGNYIAYIDAISNNCAFMVSNGVNKRELVLPLELGYIECFNTRIKPLSGNKLALISPNAVLIYDVSAK